jgi:hypothetical protein
MSHIFWTIWLISKHEMVASIYMQRGVRCHDLISCLLCPWNDRDSNVPQIEFCCQRGFWNYYMGHIFSTMCLISKHEMVTSIFMEHHILCHVLISRLLWCWIARDSNEYKIELCCQPGFWKYYMGNIFSTMCLTSKKEMVASIYMYCGFGCHVLISCLWRRWNDRDSNVLKSEFCSCQRAGFWNYYMGHIVWTIWLISMKEMVLSLYMQCHIWCHVSIPCLLCRWNARDSNMPKIEFCCQCGFWNY